MLHIVRYKNSGRALKAVALRLSQGVVRESAETILLNRLTGHLTARGAIRQGS
jgi:hypothetical protein